MILDMCMIIHILQDSVINNDYKNIGDPFENCPCRPLAYF